MTYMDYRWIVNHLRTGGQAGCGTNGLLEIDRKMYSSAIEVPCRFSLPPFRGTKTNRNQAN